MYQIPAEIHLAVARELDGNLPPIFAKAFYVNWGKSDELDDRLRNLIFPVGDAPVFERCARITKVYVLTGGLHIPERIRIVTHYLSTADFGFAPFSVAPGFMPDVFLGCLVGVMEAAHFLLFDLEPIYLVDEGNRPCGSLEMQTNICNAAFDCLNDCLKVMHRAERHLSLPEKNKRARLSAMLKDFFAISSDKTARDVALETLFLNNPAPELNFEKLGNPTCFDFMIREIFYCRIHGMSYDEMERFIRTEAERRTK